MCKWGYLPFVSNYNKQKPTGAQIKAISNLMAWSADKYGLSPEDISAHYQLADTNCPGEHLQKIYEDGTFHQAVKEHFKKFQDD